MLVAEWDSRGNQQTKYGEVSLVTAGGEGWLTYYEKATDEEDAVEEEEDGEGEEEEEERKYYKRQLSGMMI